MITIWRVGEGGRKEERMTFSNLHFKQRSMGGWSPREVPVVGGVGAANIPMKGFGI